MGQTAPFGSELDPDKAKGSANVILPRHKQRQKESKRGRRRWPGESTRCRQSLPCDSLDESTGLPLRRRKRAPRKLQFIPVQSLDPSHGFTLRPYSQARLAYTSLLALTFQAHTHSPCPTCISLCYPLCPPLLVLAFSIGLPSRHPHRLALAGSLVRTCSPFSTLSLIRPIINVPSFLLHAVIRTARPAQLLALYFQVTDSEGQETGTGCVRICPSCMPLPHPTPHIARSINT